MRINKDELLSSYDYEYPPELVAQEPLSERSASRMMLLRPTCQEKKQQIRHELFCNLPEYLAPGDLVVVNNTQVLASRLFTKKKSGGLVEVFLLKGLDSESAQPVWEALLSPVRGIQAGMELQVYSRAQESLLPFYLTLLSGLGNTWQVAFASRQAERKILQEMGEVPLPPYIKRPLPREQDKMRYQTCFAQEPGAVAAPTAGLHFDQNMMSRLQERGVQIAKVTLHVGRGTFSPVKVEDLSQHQMHQEYYGIPQQTQELLAQTQKAGGKILAIGTTTLRALESFANTGKIQGWTDLFIRPGYEFRLVKNLLTNFHQPRSTLLMLVSALIGREFLQQAYQEAIAQSYRLFSYGDCMLVEGLGN